MRFARFVITGLVVALVGAWSAPPARAQACGFVLGFATIHDLIPQIVGDCVTNEQHNPENGDALQVTTNGLMVWRKSDNFTAFTDGFRSWVNGPFGVQTRLNSQRFFWESNPEGLPIVPAPQPGERCHTAGLSLSLIGTDAGAGNVVATFQFTNELNVPCTFFGFVGAQLRDAENNPLPTTVIRGGGFVANDPGPMLVNVPPGGTAIFRMHWGQVPVGEEVTCPQASFLAVTPPDEFVPLVIPAQITACGGGLLNVSAVRALS